jgi:uncharacterized 2Fe-2S/4Fe-4S cluster protein (DUF4445 family)
VKAAICLAENNGGESERNGCIMAASVAAQPALAGEGISEMAAAIGGGVMKPVSWPHRRKRRKSIEAQSVVSKANGNG